ncbi:hypothetical protein F0L74_21405 [Chitinophaga agrisoli]|uniref:Gasdermin bGSDM n=1 Tax=Chitinophaga agrisoli TaxID=2607653 RepID=A0A5B2VIM9_9BACT|nr:hypothetical protein [Chitinophaga agrisoli]KAA2238775.1 hypothetical protein F0L74_21405 [Chitinophaga agrisoli]
MSVFNLCSGDPVMKLLKKTFQATPIRIPEERFKPLGAIAAKGDTHKFFGRIENLLTVTTPFDKEPDISQMADVSGTKTKEVDFDLGFELLSGFLRGMGMEGASLKASFSGVQKVSFSFQDVKRHHLDIGELGNFFAGKQFNKENPAARLFMEQEATCLIVDSTIVSNNFTINAEKLSDNSVQIDVPAIQQIIGDLNAGITVKSSGSTSISFTGPTPLAFAFSAIRCEVDEDGFISFGLTRELRPVDAEDGTEAPPGVYVYPESSMIELEVVNVDKDVAAPQD